MCVRMEHFCVLVDVSDVDHVNAMGQGRIAVVDRDVLEGTWLWEETTITRSAFNFGERLLRSSMMVVLLQYVSGKL